MLYPLSYGGSAGIIGRRVLGHSPELLYAGWRGMQRLGDQSRRE
jgi:hypothetical protein